MLGPTFANRSSRRGAAALVALLLWALGGCNVPHGQQSAAAAARSGSEAGHHVSPGINEPYLDPNMNPTEVARGFESEGREVYRRRDDVLAVLDLQPGMAVADVGAGSGFYAELMADAVGSSGRVYAVEISPQWIKYLRQKFSAEGLAQVVVVEGTERSIMLPAGSLDLAFASDTYHYFEYPDDTLASIYRALKPGGRWVVLDYDRIPGVTPPSRMEHLRLGKAEAIREIVAAGFALERVVDIGLMDNYLVIFRRP
jgi:predicted methyltransferase